MFLSGSFQFVQFICCRVYCGLVSSGAIWRPRSGCHQATSRYLSQFLPKSMSPYGVTMPQWVKTFYVANSQRASVVRMFDDFTVINVDNQLPTQNIVCRKHYAHWIIHVIHLSIRGWGLGAFLRWWPPSAMWAGLLILYGHNRWCLNNPIFSNLGLWAACSARFMCHHELWPTSVCHPFSSVNCSSGLTVGKYYQKITIPVFRLILPNFASPGWFSYILLSLYFLLTFFWLGCYCSMWLCISPRN